MKLKKYKLGELITQRREKYDGKETLCSWGVSRDGFIRPKQEDADTSIYNVFYRNDFVFNPARMELNSIALNSFYDKAICSSLYEIFYVTREDIVLPEYLNMFIKRDEFARRCWYEAIGSARNYFRVGDLSQFDITLPSIAQQRKYVDVYLALQNNLVVYQSKAEELKMVCDGYIDQLKVKVPKQKIGDLLELVDKRNSELTYAGVQGININKTFFPTVANIDEGSTRNYKVVEHNQFAFSGMQTGRDMCIRIALNEESKPVIISPAYTVFRIKDDNVVLSHYIMLWFSRKQIDRYGWFASDGSIRSNLDLERFFEMEIPIPDISVQRQIVNIHKCYIERQRIADALKEQIKNICPVLIRGSLT
jgi:type I restriction enzyme S subunit